MANNLRPKPEFRILGAFFLGVKIQGYPLISWASGDAGVEHHLFRPVF